MDSIFETDSTNFTVVLPGPCNAKCGFCESANDPKVSNDFLLQLRKAIAAVPSEIKQVSVSGGEPTISPFFDDALEILHKFFPKIVLTTNGAKLVEKLHVITDYVTHINLSRHSASQKHNEEIFKTKVIGDEIITTCIDILGSNGIDVTYNCVYGSEDTPMTRPEAEALIESAKRAGAVRVNFRLDQNLNQLKSSRLESSFTEYNTLETTGCPVCLSHHKRIKGLPVSFKYTLAEPDSKASGIYELILQPNGELTTDWAGESKYADVLRTIKLLESKPIISTPAPPIGSSSCGGSGCGSPTFSGYFSSCGGGRSSC